MSAVSPTLDHFAIDVIEQMPEYAPLAVEPSTEGVREAMGKLENGKAVGTDICSKKLKLRLTQDSDILKRLHIVVLTM